jgi:hypothetical protein
MYRRAVKYHYLKETTMAIQLKKSFRFNSKLQAQSFIGVAAVYGKICVTGSVAVFQGALEFESWRKLCNLAKLIKGSTTIQPDIEQMKAQAGLQQQMVYLPRNSATH